MTSEKELTQESLKQMRLELDYYYKCIIEMKRYTSNPLVQQDLMHVYRLVEKLEKSILEQEQEQEHCIIMQKDLPFKDF